MLLVQFLLKYILISIIIFKETFKSKLKNKEWKKDWKNILNTEFTDPVCLCENMNNITCNNLYQEIIWYNNKSPIYRSQNYKFYIMWDHRKYTVG